MEISHIPTARGMQIRLLTRNTDSAITVEVADLPGAKPSAV